MNGTPTPASLQEPELMRRVAQQDKDAFSGLYDRYSQLAFNLAWRVLNERQEAEDVVQEVFLQVWREAASFDMKRGNLSTWIATITRSRAIDKLRSRKARRIYNAGNEDSGEVVERLPGWEWVGITWTIAFSLTKHLPHYPGNNALPLKWPIMKGCLSQKSRRPYGNPWGPSRRVFAAA
jgi:RNA polymerase sigma factor (sigma-70 family)